VARLRAVAGRIRPGILLRRLWRGSGRGSGDGGGRGGGGTPRQQGAVTCGGRGAVMPPATARPPRDDGGVAAAEAAAAAAAAEHGRIDSAVGSFVAGGAAQAARLRAVAGRIRPEILLRRRWRGGGRGSGDGGGNGRGGSTERRPAAAGALSCRRRRHGRCAAMAGWRRRKLRRRRRRQRRPQHGAETCGGRGRPAQLSCNRRPHGRRRRCAAAAALLPHLPPSAPRRSRDRRRRSRSTIAPRAALGATFQPNYSASAHNHCIQTGGHYNIDSSSAHHVRLRIANALLQMRVLGGSYDSAMCGPRCHLSGALISISSRLLYPEGLTLQNLQLLSTQCAIVNAREYYMLLRSFSLHSLSYHYRCISCISFTGDGSVSIVVLTSFNLNTLPANKKNNLQSSFFSSLMP
jgi:hypothetical protein